MVKHVHGWLLNSSVLASISAAAATFARSLKGGTEAAAVNDVTLNSSFAAVASVQDGVSREIVEKFSFGLFFSRYGRPS